MAALLWRGSRLRQPTFPVGGPCGSIRWKPALISGKGASVFFGNRSIGIHLFRGILGLAVAYVAVRTMNSALWLSVILLPAILFLWKG